jgi:hypothetical protein
LVASTVLTLLVVPVVYTLFDDAEGWLRKLLRRPVDDSPAQPPVDKRETLPATPTST